MIQGVLLTAFSVLFIPSCFFLVIFHFPCNFPLSLITYIFFLFNEIGLLRKKYIVVD